MRRCWASGTRKATRAHTAGSCRRCRVVAVDISEARPPSASSEKTSKGEKRKRKRKKMTMMKGMGQESKTKKSTCFARWDIGRSSGATGATGFLFFKELPLRHRDIFILEDEIMEIVDTYLFIP